MNTAYFFFLQLVNELQWKQLFSTIFQQCFQLYCKGMICNVKYKNDPIFTMIAFQISSPFQYQFKQHAILYDHNRGTNVCFNTFVNKVKNKPHYEHFNLANTGNTNIFNDGCIPFRCAIMCAALLLWLKGALCIFYYLFW